MTEGVGSMQALILEQNIFFTLTVTFEPLGSSTFYTIPPFFLYLQQIHILEYLNSPFQQDQKPC